MSNRRSTTSEYSPEAFRITTSSPFAVFINPDDVNQFAADELVKYLYKISAIELAVTKLPVFTKKNAFIIAPAHADPETLLPHLDSASELPDDGFIVRTGRNFAALGGPNPRGALYSVYAFLEELGCRFYGLGEEGEIIPSMSVISVPVLDMKEKPTFLWREWKEDMGYVMRTDDPNHKKRHEEYFLKLWDWMGKNRINLSQNRDYPKGQTVSALRGIRHPTGGHMIPGLMPRELFSEHPDYFRMDRTGKRVPTGNFCPSNEGALSVVAENAAEYVRKNSWAVSIEVVGADVWEGSWCYCPDCKKMTVQDQYITACNVIARAIRETGSDMKIDAMAYHDTLVPDLTVKPDPDLRMMWAPRERSFGHAHNDPRSEINQWYSDCLEKWAEIFGPEKIDLFEYWHDNILFRSFPIAIPHIVAQDIRYYTDIGINNHCVTCHLGDYAFQSEPLNCYVFTKMLYNRDLDVDEIIADYCNNMYGPAAETMLKWHNDFEEAMRYCATFGDIQRVPAQTGPRVEKLMSEISRSLKQLRKTNMLLKQALSETSDPRQAGRIRTQSWVNYFGILMVSGLLHQVKGEYHLARIDLYVWRRKGANRDPYEGFSGRYVQVRDEFQKSIKFYEDAVAFINSLPPEEHSVWCDTSLPRHNKRVCDEMRAKIEESEKHI